MRVFSVFLSGLVFLAAAVPAEAAGERSGARVVVERVSGGLIEGELIAVRAQALVVADTVSMASSDISLGDVFRVKIIRKTRLLKGLGLGSLFGGVIGGSGTFGYGAAAGYYGGDWQLFTPEDMFLGGAVYGVAFGLIVGALAAYNSGLDLEYAWRSLSSGERERALKKLRKLSRFPNE